MWLVHFMWLLPLCMLCNCHMITSPKVACGIKDPACVCRLGWDSEGTVKLQGGRKTKQIASLKWKKIRDWETSFSKACRFSGTKVINKRLAAFFFPTGDIHTSVTGMPAVTPRDWWHTLHPSCMKPAWWQEDMGCSGADLQLLSTRSEAPGGAGQPTEVFRDRFHSALYHWCLCSSFFMFPFAVWHWLLNISSFYLIKNSFKWVNKCFISVPNMGIFLLVASKKIPLTNTYNSGQTWKRTIHFKGNQLLQNIISVSYNVKKGKP